MNKEELIANFTGSLIGAFLGCFVGMAVITLLFKICK